MEVSTRQTARYKSHHLIDQTISAGFNMIGYIEGKLFKKEDDKVLILSGYIGYEVLVPAFVMQTLKEKKKGDEISFYIYYHQTERQPKPVLIGFNREIEKEFFQYFISVSDIGPLKAIKALHISVSEIATAIESKNVNRLKQLNGIGSRTAEKIIASLCGRMDKFALASNGEQAQIYNDKDFSLQVLNVLVEQLGHRHSEAKKMISEALKRKKSIKTPEQLFDEIYKGKQNP